MRGFLTFIGALFCVLLGIPLVLAATWAVGMTSAALSDTFFGDVADKVVERVPTLVERSFEAAQQPGALRDPDAQAWVGAMAKVETPLPQVMEQSGFNAWLREELAPSLREAGRAVRGEVPPGDVAIEFGRLKAALTSPVVKDYVRAVVAELPPCSPAQIEAWRARAAAQPGEQPPPPACDPGAEVIDRGFAVLEARAAALPEREPMFQREGAPAPLDFVPQSRALVWLVFLAPALVILLGAALAGRGGKGFLGWSGGSILTGGLLALASSWFAGSWLLPLAGWDQQRFAATFGDSAWTADGSRLVAAEVIGTVDDFLAPLFGDVQTIAIGVTAVGLVLVILALLAPRPART